MTLDILPFQGALPNATINATFLLTIHAYAVVNANPSCDPSVSLVRSSLFEDRRPLLPLKEHV